MNKQECLPRSAWGLMATGGASASLGSCWPEALPTSSFFFSKTACLPGLVGLSNAYRLGNALKTGTGGHRGLRPLLSVPALGDKALPLCPRASNAKQGQCLDPARNTASARVDKWGVWKTRMTPESWSPS